MENIQIIEIKTIVGLETYVVIDIGNDNFTTMLKSTYDAQQEHLTEKVADSIEE